MQASTPAQPSSAHALMQSHYPCHPTAGIRAHHELPAEGSPLASSAPREPTCGMVADGRAYREAHEHWLAAADVGKKKPEPEDFASCICVGGPPPVLPHCPPERLTCGYYPNDPAKMPLAHEALGAARLAGFCEPMNDKAETNFLQPMHDLATRRRLWGQLCGTAGDQ